jgi:quercetin 2,3-dioxygenase
VTWRLPLYLKRCPLSRPDFWKPRLCLLLDISHYLYGQWLTLRSFLYATARILTGRVISARRELTHFCAVMTAKSRNGEQTMINTIRAGERYFSDFGWLKTYWLFSFDNYYDPNNVQFGDLRVFNDDVVDAGAGFPTHSHREMEIVTVVLSGEITHQDSIGNKTVIKAGDVQRMSAGTGIAHSEHNLGDARVHFYQIWIHPGTRGLKPGYDQKSFDPESRKNRLLAVASGDASGRDGDDAVVIHSDSTIYMADLDAGSSIDFEVRDSRGVFIYVTSGDLGINDARLTTKDQARIENETTLRLEAYDKTSLILIDVPAGRR